MSVILVSYWLFKGLQLSWGVGERARLVWITNYSAYGVFALEDTETGQRPIKMACRGFHTAMRQFDANFHWVLHIFYLYRSQSRCRTV